MHFLNIQYSRWLVSLFFSISETKRAIKNSAADIMVTSKVLIDEQKNSATPLSTARYKVTYDYMWIDLIVNFIDITSSV